MHIKLKPTWFSHKISKVNEMPLISMLLHGYLFSKTDETIRIVENPSKIKFIIGSDTEEEYIIPLWFRVYCDLFPILKFQPFRFKWEIEIPD